MTEQHPAATDLDQQTQQSSAALRELIARNIRVTQDANQDQLNFVAQMRRDAADFAISMREGGAWTDSAIHSVLVRPKTWAAEAEYVNNRYPVWVIRQKKRYGGSSLDNNTHEKNPVGMGQNTYNMISVMQHAGELVLCGSRRSANNRTNGVVRYNPDEPVIKDTFVDRGVFDKPGRSETMYKEWIADLEAAAIKYTKR